MDFRNQILVGDVISMLKEMTDKCVHMVVTSPPYWGLRDYGMEGQLGLETTPDEYVVRMVEVFREVRRVLRDDGTLWCNMGDSYTSSGRGGNPTRDTSTLEGGHESQEASIVCRQGKDGIPPKTSFRRDRIERQDDPHRGAPGLKPKDLVGMPWRLAFALQADGWWLRSDIVWSKPNPMPESVTDRPTKSHEYIFLLSKSERYFYDATAIREPMADSSIARINQPGFDQQSGGPKTEFAASHRNSRTALVNLKKKVQEEGGHGTLMADGNGHRMPEKWSNPSGRNKRSVWVIPTEAYPEAHFATYPQKLVEPCILAGTSEIGCCSNCGSPLLREVEVAYENPGNRNTNGDRSKDLKHLEHGSAGYDVRLERRTVTKGWKRGCPCPDYPAVVPSVVLDPFMGSGTTALVALRAHRDFVGIELNPEYAALARKRIEHELSQLRLF